MPIERKERPRCRKVIENFLSEHQCQLEDLLDRDRLEKIGLTDISDGLKIQARKMIEERKS